MSFPVEFATELQLVNYSELDDIGAEALIKLNEKGFEVYRGVRQADWEHVRDIAAQDDVREYCPKDLKTRFGSIAMMAAWLNRGPEGQKGRGMVLCRPIGSEDIAVDSWAGIEPTEELPEYPITLAWRASKKYQGLGLATPMVAVTPSVTRAFYDDEGVGMGFQTWGSNWRAVRVYIRAGAKLVDVRDDMRPTLNPSNLPSQLRPDVRMQWDMEIPEAGSESWGSDRFTVQRFINAGAHLLNVMEDVRESNTSVEYFDNEGNPQLPDVRFFMGLPHTLPRAA